MISDGDHVEPSVETDYVAPASASSRSRRFWIISVGALVLVIAGITTVAIALGSSGSKQNNVMTLDSVVDTTLITEPNSTTTEVPTTTPVDSTIPETSVAVTDSLAPTTAPSSWDSVPQAKPLRLAIRLDNALNTGPPGTVFTWTITVTNPGEVDKPIRITAGYQQNGAVKGIVGVRVNGCPGWRGGASGIYLGIDGITIAAASVCTVSFDVATNPTYQGDLRTVAGVYDDYDRTEKAVTASTVFLFFPEATTTTATLPETTPLITAP